MSGFFSQIITETETDLGLIEVSHTKWTLVKVCFAHICNRSNPYIDSQMDKESRFLAANDKIRKLPIDGAFEKGSTRWKLYGLSKQITDGDCKVDCPPA